MAKTIIRMTEEELMTAIKESVQQVLEESSKHLLIEMPWPRGIYKQKIDDVMPQILINWCLVRYCTVSNREISKGHWQSELRGHLLTAARHSIKGNDSVEKRQKVLEEVCYENNYLIPHFLNMTVCNKFMKENIDINSNEYFSTIASCINGIQGIFNAILSRDITYITQYIESL